MNHRHGIRYSFTKSLILLCSAFVCTSLFSKPVCAQNSLTEGDVRTIIAQAVSSAVSLNQKVTVAVTDHEGNVLGVFIMNSAPAATLIRSVGANGKGLE